MNSELLLIILKYTGGFVAASYGLYATLTDFRVEQDGKKVLTRKGYLGIALLVTSSVLALSVDGFKDYRESVKKAEEQQEKLNAALAEQEKTRIARANEQRIITQLGTQSEDLTKALTTLDENTTTSKKISDDLGTQIDVTKGVSTQLGSVSTNLGGVSTQLGGVSAQMGATVDTLNKTSRTTNALLEENVQRIDSLEVELTLLIDPARFVDVLSSKARQILEDDAEQFFDDTNKLVPVTFELQDNYNTVKNRVLAGWYFGFTLSNSNKTPRSYEAMRYSRQGELGVTGFVIATNVPRKKVFFTEDHSEYRAVWCVINYSVPPDRYAGFRKFKDLNGAEWGIELKSNPNILFLESAKLSVGLSGKSERLFINIKKGGENNPIPGYYSDTAIIPIDYF